MKAPRERMRRWPFYMDARTRDNLRVKAAAHGVSRPDYLRALINAERPGAKPGSDVALADSWWDSRSPARRASIWRNHSAAGGGDSSDEDQLTIDDAIGGAA